MNLINQAVLDLEQQHFYQKDTLCDDGRTQFSDFKLQHTQASYVILSTILIILLYIVNAYLTHSSYHISQILPLKNYQVTIQHEPEIAKLHDVNSIIKEEDLHVQLQLDSYRNALIYHQNNNYEILIPSIEPSIEFIKNSALSLTNDTQHYTWTIEHGLLTIRLASNMELVTTEVLVQRDNGTHYNFVFSRYPEKYRISQDSMELTLNKPIKYPPRLEKLTQTIQTPLAEETPSEILKKSQVSNKSVKKKSFSIHTSKHDNALAKTAGIFTSKKVNESFDDKLQRYRQGIVLEEQVTPLAQHFIQHKRLDDAIQIIGKAIERYSPSSEWCLLAAKIAILQNRPTDALHWLDLNPNKNSTEHLGFIALSQTKLAHYEQAIDSYKKLLNQQPNTMNWQLGLARNLGSAGYAQKARYVYLSILDNQPHADIRQLITADLKQLGQ